MNGVHDMGGFEDMGPVTHETDEPVFHAPWEGRIFAINRSLLALRKWNLDAWRHQIELLPAIDYLRLTYYERWLEINEQLAEKHGLIAPDELVAGVPDDPRVPKTSPALTAAVAAGPLGRGIPSANDPAVRPRFQVGEPVRARNINPTGHSRLPRYTRGKAGVVGIDHGVYTFPDTNAHFLGEKRQHVYSVRFSARELWGERASARDSVCLDLFEDYLEHA